MEEKALLTFENFPQEKVTLIRGFVSGKENASKIANTFHIRLPRDYDYYVECKSIFFEMDTYGNGQKCYIKKNTSGPLSLNEKGTVNPAYNIDNNQIPWLILRNLVPTNSTLTDLTPAISYTIDPLACVVTQEVKVDYKGLVRYWYKYSGDNLDNDKIEKITENLLMYMGDGRHVQYRKSPTEGRIITYQFGKKTTIEKYVQGEGYYYEANIDGIVPTYKLFFDPHDNSIFYEACNDELKFSCCIENLDSGVPVHHGRKNNHQAVSFMNFKTGDSSLDIYANLSSFCIVFSTSEKGEIVNYRVYYKGNISKKYIERIIQELKKFSESPLLSGGFFNWVVKNLDNFADRLDIYKNRFWVNDVCPDAPFEEWNLEDMFENEKKTLLASGNQETERQEGGRQKQKTFEVYKPIA